MCRLAPHALGAVLATLLLGACTITKKDAEPDTAAAATTAQPAPAAPAPAPTDSASLAGTAGAAGAAGATSPDSAMRLEVDIKARRLYVYRGQGSAAADTFRVAVGSQKWPTQTGEWTVRQVVFNPEWVPPDETWAEEREPRKPGDPKNPLGRAQLVYDPPRTIHGTNAPSSIGTATSHGSIRMRNEDILSLARDVMRAGGAQRDSAFFRQTEQHRTEKQVVDLARPIPIRVF
ncbi:MAG: L,D-transpeptidase [Gemmatimonadaceae bacterium]